MNTFATRPAFRRQRTSALWWGVGWFFFFGLCAAVAFGQQASNYKLKADDLIEVRIFKEDNLAANVRVAGDGSVTLPLIGTAKVGGLSVAEAISAIAGRYRDGYLVKPQVSITVSDYGKQRYTVLGQVVKPGVFEVPADTNLTLLQAIGMAGGYTDYADQSRVILKRLANGRDNVIRLNPKAMAKGAERNFYIQSGDVISVGQSIF